MSPVSRHFSPSSRSACYFRVPRNILKMIIVISRWEELFGRVTFWLKDDELMGGPLRVRVSESLQLTARSAEKAKQNGEKGERWANFVLIPNIYHT